MFVLWAANCCVGLLRDVEIPKFVVLVALFTWLVDFRMFDMAAADFFLCLCLATAFTCGGSPTIERVSTNCGCSLGVVLFM